MRLQAEDGQLTGVTVSTATTGYTGGGYVTGFDEDNDQVALTVRGLTAGLYNVFIRYRAPSGEKGYDLAVNGARYSGKFAQTKGDAWATHTAGEVELRTGSNTLVIAKGWGYFDIDYVDLVPAAPPRALRKPPKTLVDARATPEARALMARLVNTYGSAMLSGQFEQPDIDYIRQVTRAIPAIYASDLIDFSPSRRAFGADPKNMVQKVMAAHKNGHLITLMWHWNAPNKLINKTYTDAKGQKVDASWYRGFYTNATTFDLQSALANPKGEDYRLLLRDIDAIAIPLAQLARAGAPILWRPLHEAEGTWFWWGAKGPDALKALWRIMFERLTAHHNLHNLIWVFTAGDKADWYPGDKFVDIVGADLYPSDPFDPGSEFYDSLRKRFEGRKLLALTEFGGVPDVEKMRRFGVLWSYFVSWSGDLGPKKITKDDLARIYHNRTVINRGQLPR